MDDYLDHYFSSLSWSDVNAKERTSWVHGEPDHQMSLLLPSSLGICQDDERNLPASMVSLNHTMECLATNDPSSTVPSAESDCGVDDGLLSVEAGTDSQNCNGSSSKGLLTGSLRLGNLALQHNTAVHNPDMVNLDYPKQLPVGGLKSLSFTESGHVGHIGGLSMSEFQGSHGELQTLSPIPQLWPSSSYEAVSPLPTLMGQNRIQSSCLQVGNVHNDGNIDRYVDIDNILKPEILSASIPKSASANPNGGCNGTGKPRVRARRGQATDPHSIAERLRREKIAERMRNLQELVPNSNKTDKASMLDEIIEYVKFLQLQVKVLSMSRLGAAGAVVPLITDGQAEGTNGLLLSPLAGQGADFSPSPDQIAFEQEVVKLMESNVTMAMQFLQSKGLCLMPVALAAAISSGKASAPGAASEDRKFSFNNGLVHKSSSSSSSNSSGSFPAVGTRHPPSDANIVIGKPGIERNMINGCNGNVKQEEISNSSTAKRRNPETFT